jgi:hypothetical protein
MLMVRAAASGIFLLYKGRAPVCVKILAGSKAFLPFDAQTDYQDSLSAG